MSTPVASSKPVLPTTKFTPPRQFQNTPIISLSYHLYASFHTLLLTFPKTQRYSLGANTQAELLKFIKLLLRAAATSNEVSKAALLREASVTLDTLKLLLSLCKDCRCFTNQAYQQLESEVSELGKMLGGWLKAYA